MYKSEINYNFGYSELKLSSLNNSKIESFYKILSEENRNYFNHKSTYKEYISKMNSLFQTISKELENQSQNDIDGAKNFCENFPFYQKYNEFLNIYSKILRHYKSDENIEKINDRYINIYLNK